MKEKSVFYSEASYFIGILVLVLGTALMEKGDFGMSIVVALAYLIHLKVSEYLPWFSFGMSEYIFRALLLALLSLTVGRFKKSYILSFATVFLYGAVLDAMISLVALFLLSGLVWRIVLYR